MFGFITSIPSRLRNILSKFKKHFTKPQYKNFCRTMLGLIAAGKGEHDVKSINELFIDRKDQSSLNRFITESKWDVEEVVKTGRELLLGEAEHDPAVEIKVIDDTVCRKYSPKTEMVCYNHSSTMGTVLSHSYVSSLYVNGGVAVPDGLKLYGSEKKCRVKGVQFRTKVQLACELIRDHTPRADKTILLWDSWYTCSDLVEECKARGYSWIGEIKGNRVVLHGGKRIHLRELVEEMCREGGFTDVAVDGELYQACKVEAYLPRIGDISIVADVKVGTDDVHLLCTDMVGCGVGELLGYALERHRVEDYYRGAKALGLGEYRFRGSEAALIHAHLVSLACALLDVLRRRLLRYSITGCLLSMGSTVEWVRRKVMHGFIHMVRGSKLPMRSLLRLIDTRS
jgi:hypothetical protein